MGEAKPQVCIVDERIAVFLGSDYKFLDVDGARKLIQLLQRNKALLERQIKRQKRAVR